jgi:hypothetical protein
MNLTSVVGFKSARIGTGIFIGSIQKNSTELGWSVRC